MLEWFVVSDNRTRAVATITKHLKHGSRYNLSRLLLWKVNQVFRFNLGCIFYTYMWSCTFLLSAEIIFKKNHKSRVFFQNIKPFMQVLICNTNVIILTRFIQLFMKLSNMKVAVLIFKAHLTILFKNKINNV
jgi:hypothetical protein